MTLIKMDPDPWWLVTSVKRLLQRSEVMLGVWLKEGNTRGGKVMSLERRKEEGGESSDRLVDDSRGFRLERRLYQRFERR